jgi:hypothetical protein
MYEDPHCGWNSKFPSFESAPVYSSDEAIMSKIEGVVAQGPWMA